MLVGSWFVGLCGGGLSVHLLPRNVRLQRREFHVAQKDDLMCSVWMDTKPVVVLSNYHHPAAHGVVQQRNAEGVCGSVVVTKALQDYQLHMKCVDLCDQMTGYYQIEVVAMPILLPADGGSTQCVHRRKKSNSGLSSKISSRTCQGN